MRRRLVVLSGALLNYASGYALSPVRRRRCCHGTVPAHGTACATRRFS